MASPLEALRTQSAMAGESGAAFMVWSITLEIDDMMVAM